MKKTIGLLCALGILAVCVKLAPADPPYNVIGTNLSATAVGTLGALFEPFKIKTEAGSPVDFEAKAKMDVRVIVQRHDYADVEAGRPASTGWHHHPGPVFISVTQGTLTFYEVDDPSCTPHVYSAGQGFVDYGSGHIGRAEQGPAQDVTVAIAPVEGKFRYELSTGANPNCPFED
jgi:hypothetical protein